MCIRDRSSAEHLSQEIVSQGKQLRIESVLAHQQPAGETLFNAMEPVAGGKLCDLHAMHESEVAEFRAE